MRLPSRRGARRRRGSGKRVGNGANPLLMYSTTQAQVVVVVVDAELELDTIAKIESCAAPGAGQSSRRIVIDLTEVESIANHEFAALVGMLRRAFRNDVSVAIVGADPRTRRLLTELDLDRLLFGTVLLALGTVHPSALTPERSSELSVPAGARDRRVEA